MILINLIQRGPNSQITQITQITVIQEYICCFTSLVVGCKIITYLGARTLPLYTLIRAWQLLINCTCRYLIL